MDDARPRPSYKCAGCGYLLLEWQERCPECGGRFYSPQRYRRPLGPALPWETSPAGLAAWFATARRVLRRGDYAAAIDLDAPPRHAGSFVARGVLLYLVASGLFVALPVLGEVAALHGVAAAARCRPVQFRGVFVSIPSGQLNRRSSAPDYTIRFRLAGWILLVLAIHGAMWFETAVPLHARGRTASVVRSDERVWMSPVVRAAADYAAMSCLIWAMAFVLSLVVMGGCAAVVFPALWSVLEFVWFVGLSAIIVFAPVTSLCVANRTMRSTLARLQPSFFLAAG